MPTVPPTIGAVDYRAATETLYRSFADVTFRADMPRCPHCVSTDDVTALAAPARALPPSLVSRFVTKAGTTWGRSDDLRRVAPRALHLAAEQQLPVSRSLVLHQLAEANWAGWPPHQVDAVCRFLLAEWERLLLSPPRAGHSAHRWLRQTATAVTDLDPFLTSWHRLLGETPPGAPAVHLAVLLVNSELRPDFPSSIADLFDPPARPDGHDPTSTPAVDPSDAPAMDPSTPLAEQLGAWLAGPATEADLHRAQADLAHTPDARRLTLALERLRRYRSARTRPT